MNLGAKKIIRLIITLLAKEPLNILNIFQYLIKGANLFKLFLTVNAHRILSLAFAKPIVDHLGYHG
jgi:predicted amino acid-binding ACT domain protein